MPDPLSFGVRLFVTDFDPGPVSAANASILQWSFAVDAAAAAAEIAGQRIIGFGRSLIDVASSSVTAFMQLEATMLEVSKTTGLVGGSLDSLTASMIDMSRATPIAATELAEIAAIAGQLGISGSADIEAFIQVVSQIAVSSDLTVEAASNAFGRLGHIFDITTDKFQNLGSSIQGLAIETTATAASLVDFMQRVGPSGRLLGLTAQQAGALGATLIDLGLTAETAGTAMSNLFSRMAARTAKFARIAGVSAGELEAALGRNPLEAIKLLSVGINEIAKKSGVRAIAAMEGLGLEGQRVRTAFLALSGSSKMLSKNMVIANEEFADGTLLQRQFATMISGLRAQLSILANRFQALALSVGSVFVPPLTIAVRVLSFFVDLLNLVPRPILALGAAALAAVGGVIALVGIMMVGSAALIRFKVAMAVLAGADLIGPLGLVTGSFLALRQQIMFMPLPAFAEGARTAVVAGMNWFSTNVLLAGSAKEAATNILLGAKALALEGFERLKQIPAMVRALALRISSGLAALREAAANRLNAIQIGLSTTGTWALIGAKTVEVKTRAFGIAVMVKEAFAKAGVAAATVWENITNKLWWTWQIAAIKARYANISAIIAERVAIIQAARARGMEVVATAQFLALSPAEKIARLGKIPTVEVESAAIMRQSFWTWVNIKAKLTSIWVTIKSAASTALLAATLLYSQGVTVLATIAQHGFNAALMANPIGLVIGTVILFVVVLGLLIKKIHEGSNVAAALGIALGLALWPISAPLGAALLLFTAFRRNILGVRTVVLFLARTIGFVVGTIVRAVGELFAPIGTEFSDLVSTVAGFFDPIREFFSGATSDASGFFRALRAITKVAFHLFSHLFMLQEIGFVLRFLIAVAKGFFIALRDTLAPLFIDLADIGVAFGEIGAAIGESFSLLAGIFGKSEASAADFFKFVADVTRATIAGMLMPLRIIIMFLGLAIRIAVAGLLLLFFPITALKLAFGRMWKAIVQIKKAFFGSSFLHIAEGVRPVLSVLRLLTRPFELLQRLATGIHDAFRDFVNFMRDRMPFVGRLLGQNVRETERSQRSTVRAVAETVISSTGLVGQAAVAIGRALFGSSLLHIGEGAEEAAGMIRASLVPALQELQAPDIRVSAREAPGPLVRAAAGAVGKAAAAVSTSGGRMKAPSPPGGGRRRLEITVPISLLVDGRVLAETVRRVECEDDIRSFGALRFSPVGEER